MGAYLAIAFMAGPAYHPCLSTVAVTPRALGDREDIAMAETTTRVARWRQRLRDEGKAALTIRLTTDEKLRLEDLARTWHTSPSALIQQVLAQFQPTQPARSATDTDTSQLRLLIRKVLGEELPGMVRELLVATATVTETSADTVTDTRSTAPVTDMVTETVAATLARDLPALVRQIVEGMALEAIGLSVTDTHSVVTDTMAMEGSSLGQAPAYDTDRYYLGTLCPRRHEWQSTGQSLRHTRNRVCLECDREKTAERRQARRREAKR